MFGCSGGDFSPIAEVPDLGPEPWVPKVGDEVQFSGDETTNPALDGAVGRVAKTWTDGEIEVDFGPRIGVYITTAARLSPPKPHPAVAAAVVKGLVSVGTERVILFKDAERARQCVLKGGGYTVGGERISWGD